MSEDRPISRWLGDLQDGVAPEAEQGLWEEYFERLCALAQVQLSTMPATYEGAEDVVLSAMNSFFSRFRAGAFPRLKDRTELWPLLVQTTIWKSHNTRRRHLTQARDARRSLSLNWLAEHQPTIELANRVVERGNSLLESLTDEKLQTVAKLKLEGYTNAEIAVQIGRSVKTVEWRLKQIRKQLLAAMEETNDR